MIFCAFLLLWILFNGRATPDVLLTGAAAAAGISWFCRHFLDYRPRREHFLLKNFLPFLHYIFYLIWQMLLAKLHVIRLVLSPKAELKPCLVSFRSKLKTPVGRVLLANSITLTPGTITAELTKGQFLVHALTKEMAQGIESSHFEALIDKMEGVDR